MAKRKQIAKPKIDTALIATADLKTSKSNFSFAYFIVFAFGFLLYANSISNDYAVDDTLVITDNDFTQNGVAGIKDIFTHDAFIGHYGERGGKLVAGGRYRPLSIASFALEVQLFGSNKPHVSHAINALIYGITGVVLLFLLLQLFPSKNGKSAYAYFGFWVVLVYLAHPIHTEAVANIKGRDELFAFLFSILALVTTVRYMQTKKRYWLAVSAMAFALGIFSKENTVTFLAIIPLALYVFYKPRFKDVAFSVLLPVLITGLFLYLRETFTHASDNKGTSEILNNPFIYSTFSEHYGTVIYTFLLYLKLLVIPYPLTHDYYPYHVPVTQLTSVIAIFSALFNIALLVWGVLQSLKRKPIGFAILFYYITFSVVSQLLFQVGTNMSERFVYMPSFGFVLAIGLVLNHFLEKQARLKIGVFAIVVGVFSCITFLRNPDWKNNYTLFAADTEVSTESMKANMEFGGELTAQAITKTDTNERKKLLRLAVKHLEKAVDLYPDKNNDGKAIGYVNAYNLLGNALFHLGEDYAKIENAYLMALKYRPDHFDALQNLVVVYNEQKKYSNSLPILRALRAEKPDDARFVYQLADCYKGLDKIDSAILMYKKSMEMDAKNITNANYNIGVCYARHLGNFTQGIPFLQKAYEAEPANTVYAEDLAVAYGMSGQPAKAAPILEKMVADHPDYIQGYQNLILTYTLLKNDAKVNEYKQKLDALSK